MTLQAIAFLILSGMALIILPRRWAFIPIFVGASYAPRIGVQVGPFTFTILRILICIGLARVLSRRESVGGGFSSLDGWMVGWGLWLVASTVFHDHVSSRLVFRLGLALDGMGLYFLLRTFCQSREEIARMCAMLAVILTPLAVVMLIEKATAYSAFSTFGAFVELQIRDGKVRAQGPFGTPILAGNVGGVCLPLMLGMWWTNRRAALLGAAACVAPT